MNPMSDFITHVNHALKEVTMPEATFGGRTPHSKPAGRKKTEPISKLQYLRNINANEMLVSIHVKVLFPKTPDKQGVFQLAQQLR